MKPTLPNKHRLIQIGIVATFLLVPVWKRFPTITPAPNSAVIPPPLFLPVLYVSYFWILVPILWTIFWWLVAGLPGLAALRRDTLRAGWALAFMLLTLWVFASPMWAFQRNAHPEVATSASLQFGLMAVFIIAVACAGPPPRVIVATLIVGLLWNSVLALFQEAYQSSVGLRAVGEFPISINQTGVSVIQAGAIRWLRPYGLLAHPNMLSGFLVVGLLAALAWVLSQRLALWRAGVLIVVVGWWALLLTFSRGAWLGLAAGGFAVLPLLLRARTFKLNNSALFAPLRLLLNPRLIVLSIIIVAVGLIFAVLFRPLLAARAGVGEESLELRSVSDRIVFADFAYRSILEHPVFGVGIGNFPWRASYYLVETTYDLRGDNVHHVLLSAWAELGVVGFGLAMAALILGVETALKSLRANRRSDHPNTGDELAAIVLLGGFFALTFIGLLDHYPWTLLQFQILWWGLLATAGKPLNLPPALPQTESTAAA